MGSGGLAPANINRFLNLPHPFLDFFAFGSADGDGSAGGVGGTRFEALMVSSTLATVRDDDGTIAVPDKRRPDIR